MYRRRRTQPGSNVNSEDQDPKKRKSVGKDELFIAENYEPSREVKMFAVPPQPPNHAYEMSDSTDVLKPDVYYQKPNQQ